MHATFSVHDSNNVGHLLRIKGPVGLHLHHHVSNLLSLHAPFSRVFVEDLLHHCNKIVRKRNIKISNY